MTNLVLLSQFIPDGGQLLAMAAPWSIKLNKNILGCVLCHLETEMNVKEEKFYQNSQFTSSKFLATNTFTPSLSQSSGISSDIR